MKKNPDIVDFLAAGSPLLFIRTFEPEAAEEAVKNAIRQLSLDCSFAIWKATTGLMEGRFDADVLSNKKADDLMEGLKYVQNSTDPVISIFHNVRHFMQNFMAIQQIIDTAVSAKLSGSHVIFVGPMLELPPELTPLMMYIDLPLPTREKIAKEFIKVIDAYKDDIKIPKKKNELDSLVREASNSAVGLPMSMAENALALSLATTGKIDIEVIQKQKEQEVKKSDCLEFIDTPVSMENVGGFKSFKKWLRRRSKVFTDEAREYGLPYPRGILLIGQPGSGKSLAAKAVASYLKLPLVKLDVGKVFRSLVGESEQAIRTALKTVEAVSPVVLWIDEIEKALAGTKRSGTLDSGVTARVVSTILTWRQETAYPVMLVATANDVESIPPTVYRKGRMDEIWATDLPTLEERIEIYEIHINKRNRDPKKFKLKELAESSKELVGSEIESCIEDGMFYAFDEGKELETCHILRAISETIPQAKRDAEEIKKIRDWVKVNARNVGDVQEPSMKGKNKTRKIEVLNIDDDSFIP